MLDPEGHKEKTARNRESSARLLRDRGIAFTAHNRGAHLVVTHAGRTADFWPGTGKWIFRGMPGYEGRGVRNLVEKLRSNHERKPESSLYQRSRCSRYN